MGRGGGESWEGDEEVGAGRGGEVVVPRTFCVSGWRWGDSWAF